MSVSVLEAATWPIERAHELLRVSAPGGGGELAGRRRSPQPPDPDDRVAFREWMDATAGGLGIELEPVHCQFREVEALVARGAPMFALVKVGEHVRLCSVVRSSPRRVHLLAPDHGLVEVPTRSLLAGLRGMIEARLPAKPPLPAGVAAGVDSGRIARIEQALRQRRLLDEWVVGCWLVLPNDTRSLSVALRRQRVLPRVLGLLGLHAVWMGLWTLSWWLVGHAALSGTISPSWIVAWIVAVMGLAPIRAAELWHQGRLTIRIGRTLKAHLLRRVFELDVDFVRTHGIGSLLGKVMDAEQVESKTIAGALALAMASLELAVAASVLAAGPTGVAHLLLLGGMVGLVVWMTRELMHRARSWTDQRLGLTHSMVEKMLGHRTRLAQQPRGQAHLDEQRPVEEYRACSQRLDDWRLAVVGLVPKTWLALGVVVLLPSFVAGGDRFALATGVAGVLLGLAAFGRGTQGAAQLAQAAASFAQIRRLVGSIESPYSLAPAALPAAPTSGAGPAAVQVRGVAFCHRGAGRVVLDDCSLTIEPGQRLLLQGASGSGKTTLGAIIAGLRSPDRGLVLLGGVDIHTLGERAWHSRVVAVPQFHENHIMSASLAFNLLMGRGWPARSADLREAERVCHALGLGDLLRRMPSGLQQIVGDTGWQLSQGERSRVFLARALLQRADLLVLDEALGALDPRTRSRCMEAIEAEARSVLLIAHP